MADELKLSDIETGLRELLWLRHGCPMPALYGDDGEMQCSSCMVDFKRGTPEEIERKNTFFETAQRIEKEKVDKP